MTQRRRTAAAATAGLLLGVAAGWTLRGDGAPDDGDASIRPRDVEAPSRTDGRRGSAATRGARAPRGRREAGPADVARGAAEPSADGARRGNAGVVRHGATGAPGAQSSAHPSIGAASAPAAGAHDGSSTAPTHEASGVVIDAVTERPIRGARVLLAIADGPGAGGWWGATTDEDGRFHPRADDDSKLAGAHLELRVSKAGYEPARLPAAAGELRIALRPRTTPVTPGRVVGIARDAAGRPFAGDLVVEAFDESGDRFTQDAASDASGAFTLEGVPPGPLRLRWNGGRFVDATVPEDGDARVELTAPTDSDRSNFVVTDVDPSTVEIDDPHAAAALASLRRLLSEVDADPALDAGTRERVRRALALEVQDLAAAARSVLRRDIVVTGLPADGRAWLRLESKPDAFRRVEIRNGVARFASVPIGGYAAVVERPGRPEQTTTIVVPAGEGAFETAF